MNEENDITDVERVWRERWRDIVMWSDGGLDLEQLKKELYDFSVLMHGASLVYEAVTGGKASKAMTDPSVVIALFNDNVRRLIDEARKDEREERPRPKSSSALSFLRRRLGAATSPRPRSLCRGWIMLVRGRWHGRRCV